MHREQLIGQLLTLGFTGTEVTADLRALSKEISTGGFILFRRNVTTPDANRRLTDDLQKLAGRDFPAFLGIDQEGGTVARLRAPFYTEFPGNRALLADYRATGNLAAAKEQGRILAAELRMTGFNWDYAPVLDVDSNPVNPVIGKRAFSADPAEVAALGVALAQALEAGGVLSCGKHAPGHGNTSLDSHHDLPVEEVDLATLRARELVPFQAYAEANLASLMTAHVVYKQFDAQHPGTLSEPVIQGLVRKEIGFKGLIVTDDLEMKAIDGRYGVEDAVLKAVVAGCDVLLICHTPEKQLQAHAALIAEDRKSAVVRSRIDDALGRITRLKKKLVAAPDFDPSVLAHPDSLRFAERITRTEAAARAADPTEYRA